MCWKSASGATNEWVGEEENGNGGNGINYPNYILKLNSCT